MKEATESESAAAERRGGGIGGMLAQEDDRTARATATQRATDHDDDRTRSLSVSPTVSRGRRRDSRGLQGKEVTVVRMARRRESRATTVASQVPEGRPRRRRRRRRDQGVRAGPRRPPGRSPPRRSRRAEALDGVKFTSEEEAAAARGANTNLANYAQIAAADHGAAGHRAGLRVQAVAAGQGAERPGDAWRADQVHEAARDAEAAGQSRGRRVLAGHAARGAHRAQARDVDRAHEDVSRRG